MKQEQIKDVSLCLKCRMAHISTDQHGRTRVYCHSMERLLQKRIVECSAFDDKTTPSKYDFEKIAWTLDTNNKKEAMGFHPPDKHRYPGEL